MNYTSFSSLDSGDTGIYFRGSSTLIKTSFPSRRTVSLAICILVRLVVEAVGKNVKKKRSEGNVDSFRDVTPDQSRP